MIFKTVSGSASDSVSGDLGCRLPAHLVPPAPVVPDLEWRLTYVGSAESEKYDQVLDTVFVGPVAPGQYRFVFQVRGGVGLVDGEPETSWQAF